MSASGPSDEATAFDRLACRVRAQGVTVGHARRQNAAVDAIYRARQHGGPSIHLLRKDLAAPEDAWREVALLAHEFGHHCSEMRRWRTEEYLAANKRMADGCLNLSDDEVCLVLREECIAWRVAAVVLEDLDIHVPHLDDIKWSNLRAYCTWMMVTEQSARNVDGEIHQWLGVTR